MYRKDLSNKPKLQNHLSFTSINTPTYAQSKNKYLQKKVSFPANQENFLPTQRQKDKILGIRKVSTTNPSPVHQPLTFSGNTMYKKKKSISKQFTFRSSQSQSSKSTQLNQSVSTNYYCHKYHKLHKQNQQLRSQHKLLISHLLETKKTLEGMSRMYTQKCQQTQTLKSIITSLKQYIYKQRSEQIQPAQPYTRFVQYKQKDNLKEQTKIKRKISQDKKLKQNALRRISIHQILLQAPFGINSNDIKAFDSYIRQQCVQSIKGSAYEINSSTQLF